MSRDPFPRPEVQAQAERPEETGPLAGWLQEPGPETVWPEEAGPPAGRFQEPGPEAGPARGGGSTASS